MKKKLISLITAAVMALGISVPAMAADAKPMEGKLVVVHTNDMHGYYETTETSIGIAGVAGLKNYYEAQGDVYKRQVQDCQIPFCTPANPLP